MHGARAYIQIPTFQYSDLEKQTKKLSNGLFLTNQLVYFSGHIVNFELEENEFDCDLYLNVEVEENAVFVIVRNARAEFIRELTQTIRFEVQGFAGRMSNKITVEATYIGKFSSGSAKRVFIFLAFIL